jgi:hypothetical protein
MAGVDGPNRPTIVVLTTHLLPTPPGSSVDGETYMAYCYLLRLFCQDENRRRLVTRPPVWM